MVLCFFAVKNALAGVAGCLGMIPDMLPGWVQIDVLKAGWCKIGEKDGAKAIADLILFNTTLTTLDLRGNGLSNPGRI